MHLHVIEDGFDHLAVHVIQILENRTSHRLLALNHLMRLESLLEESYASLLERLWVQLIVLLLIKNLLNTNFELCQRATRAHGEEANLVGEQATGQNRDLLSIPECLRLLVFGSLDNQF